MNLFTKILSTITIASAVTLPALATNYGWGIGTEKNLKLISEMDKNCPAQLKSPDGRCRRSHRSFLEVVPAIPVAHVVASKESRTRIK